MPTSLSDTLCMTSECWSLLLWLYCCNSPLFDIEMCPHPYTHRETHTHAHTLSDSNQTSNYSSAPGVGLCTCMWLFVYVCVWEYMCLLLCCLFFLLNTHWYCIRCLLMSDTPQPGMSCCPSSSCFIWGWRIFHVNTHRHTHKQGCF